MANTPDEFALIARLFAPLAAGCPGALGLTDDAALLDCPPGRRIVITTDAMVAGVHFLPDDPPSLIARKLMRVNLSDLAAMGAEPMAVLLAACFPREADPSWMESFAAGLGEDTAEFDVPLVGGDTVATPGPATFTLTALGTVEDGRALLRSGARPGDRVWVSGSLGDAALGLCVATEAAAGLSGEDAAFLLARYRLPQPRLGLGRRLAGLASAAMDISDGLVGDLEHICAASGVAARIVASQVPLSPAGANAVALGIGGGLAAALTGGDDYELLFTAPPAHDDALRALEGELGLRLSVVGEIIAGSGVRIFGADGKPMALARHGYRHFGA